MRISDWSSDVCSSDLADAAAAAAGQRRREADVRHAQRFHQAGGVELVEIAGPGGRIIGKAVDLLMADPGIGTGVHDRLCRHVVDRARPAFAADIIVGRPDADDRAFILMRPGHMPLSPSPTYIT